MSFATKEADAGGQAITAHKLRQLHAESRLIKLISQGESATVEFKSTLRTDLRTGKPDARIEHAIVKTMAAFFNSKGGSLIVGIDDAGESVDLLDKDKFPSSDKWQQHLINIVARDLEGLVTGLWHVSIHRHDGKSVAVVDCEKSSKPVYVRDSKCEHFFVREGVTTRELGMRDAFAYIDTNF
jgi:predicted HTH transcriptional regulator